MLTGVSPLQHPKNQIILVGPTGPRMSNQSSSNYYCSEVRLPECSLVTIVAIGGGGGGAAGGTSTGGSGGGSGAMTTLTMPRVLLPHLIYCFVSIGGIGGVYNSTNPTHGGDTFISVISRNVTNNSPDAGATIINAFGGSGGGNFSSPGAGGAVSTATSMTLGWLYSSNSIAGQSGSTGGNSSSGNTVTYPTTGLIVSGGAGGAGDGASTTGGTVQNFSGCPIGMSGSSTPAGTDGTNGGTLWPDFSLYSNIVTYGSLSLYNSMQIASLGDTTFSISGYPLMAVGGNGGGGKTGSVTGTNGGNGGLGSGGGGAGSGGTAGGNGGTGGSGLIIIVCH